MSDVSMWENPWRKIKKILPKDSGACGSYHIACHALYTWILAPSGLYPHARLRPSTSLETRALFHGPVYGFRTQYTDLRPSVL